MLSNKICIGNHTILTKKNSNLDKRSANEGTSCNYIAPDLTDLMQASQRKRKQRFYLSIQIFKESSNYSQILFQINKYFQKLKKKLHSYSQKLDKEDKQTQIQRLRNTQNNNRTFRNHH